MRILFIGDIVGRPGRTALDRWLGSLRDEAGIDFVVANGENAAGGLGITPQIARELLESGVDVLTLGNHTWRQKSLAGAIDELDRVVRPANYPEGLPGRGSCVAALPDGRKVGVVNVLGRVYMEPFECPFESARQAAQRLREETPLVVVDVHAEATSEKVAMGWYLDGQCTAVLGTHTHVPTADARVLPGGTAYITDVGMTGPRDSVIGVERERVIHKFLTGMPTHFETARTEPMLCAVVVEADDATGRATGITQVLKQ
jgi:hypothetical protein